MSNGPVSPVSELACELFPANDKDLHVKVVNKTKVYIVGEDHVIVTVGSINNSESETELLDRVGPEVVGRVFLSSGVSDLNVFNFKEVSFVSLSFKHSRKDIRSVSLFNEGAPEEVGPATVSDGCDHTDDRPKVLVNVPSVRLICNLTTVSVDLDNGLKPAANSPVPAAVGTVIPGPPFAEEEGPGHTGGRGRGP